MGWIRMGKKRTPTPVAFSQPSRKENLEAAFAHIEIVPPTTQHTAFQVAKKPKKYTFQDESTTDADLPFISALEVAKKTISAVVANDEELLKEQDIWIVVDDIVYDCTTFIHDHPGGLQVIWSFSGQDCSWQFWRFHGEALMEQYGRPLRIGRTSAVPNRFKEQPKYVGLSRLGEDDW